MGVLLLALAFCVLLGTSDCPAKVFHLPAHQRFDFGFGQLRNENKPSQWRQLLHMPLLAIAFRPSRDSPGAFGFFSTCPRDILQIFPLLLRVCVCVCAFVCLLYVCLG